MMEEKARALALLEQGMPVIRVAADLQVTRMAICIRMAIVYRFFLRRLYC